MDDLLSEFITETSESINEVDMQLVEFEKDPQNEAILGNIFRLVHTVKGTCGFLGLPRLESVAHAGENVLDKYRDGALSVTPDGVSLDSAILSSVNGWVEEYPRALLCSIVRPAISASRSVWAFSFFRNAVME